MRRTGAVLLAGLIAAAGCVGVEPAGPKQAGWMDRLRRLSGPLGTDVLYMDVATLERPVGDDFLNRELWECADEQVVAVEGRSRLDDNGLRVGQTGGILPAALQAMLTSERDCVNPRHVELRSGGSTTLSLGPPAAEASFQLQLDGTATLTTLENARFALAVAPSALPDGRVRLQFTPQATHGEEPKAAASPLPSMTTGWSLQGQRPQEKFPALAWDVTLGPNEYVVVGTRCERPQTLGHVCFVTLPPAKAVQRVLVIRAGRMGKAKEDRPAGASPPLAVQAARANFRGAGE